MVSAQKVQASTQRFTEIIDFIGNVVIMSGGNACQIIEITASNFSLLSKKEQDVRVFSYAGLLNSLSFPIQILIRNKKMDISYYLSELDKVVQKTQNQRLAEYIKLYRNFVQEVMTMNIVLNKSFYVIIPYSSLEKLASAVTQTVQGNKSQIEIFAESAHRALEVKTNTIIGQLRKFAVTAKILEKEELIKLFYDLYNEDDSLDVERMTPGINTTMIAGEEEK